MSPIEEIWALIKSKLWDIIDQISTKEEMFESAKKFFFSQEVSNLCQKNYNSMPNRLELVKKNEGQ